MADPMRTALINALHGRHAHAAPLVVLEVLSASQASRRPRRALATIWEQLAHMVFWQDIMLARLRGERPSYPKTAAEGWPAMPPNRDQEEWSDLVAHFASGLRAAEQMARRIDLGNRVSGKTGKRAAADQLMSLATHNSYHLGQIVSLRRLLNLWPPPSGGDTW